MLGLICNRYGILRYCLVYESINQNHDKKELILKVQHNKVLVVFYYLHSRGLLEEIQNILFLES